MLAGDLEGVINLVGDEDPTAGGTMPDIVINKLLDLALKYGDNKVSKKLTKDHWNKIIDEIDEFIFVEKITCIAFSKEQFQTKLSSLKTSYNGLVFIKSLSGIGSCLNITEDLEHNHCN